MQAYLLMVVGATTKTGRCHSMVGFCNCNQICIKCACVATSSARILGEVPSGLANVTKIMAK